MRKITKEASSAFMSARAWQKGNTKVTVIRREDMQMIVTMYLHGNVIAQRHLGDTRKFSISHGGWKSNTTKERLNGLPGVSVCQKNFRWYLNGNPWDGDWQEISI